MLKPSEYPFVAEAGNVNSSADTGGVVSIVGGDIQGLRFENLSIGDTLINETNFRDAGSLTVVGSPGIEFD